MFKQCSCSGVNWEKLAILLLVSFAISVTASSAGAFGGFLGQEASHVAAVSHEEQKEAAANYERAQHTHAASQTYKEIRSTSQAFTGVINYLQNGTELGDSGAVAGGEKSAGEAGAAAT